MFYVDGWTPLSTMTSEVYRLARQRLGERSKRDKSTVGLSDIASECAMLMWQICDDSDQRGVLTASGKVVYATPRLLSWLDPAEYEGLHVDLAVGTVGSGKKSLSLEHFRIKGSLRQMATMGAMVRSKAGAIIESDYGRFKGQPVLLPESYCARELEKLGKQNLEDKRTYSDSEKVNAIVDAFDQDPRITKAWVKECLMTDEKVIVFETIWKQAAERRPGLSKPGPRSRRS